MAIDRAAGIGAVGHVDGGGRFAGGDDRSARAGFTTNAERQARAPAIRPRRCRCRSSPMAVTVAVPTDFAANRQSSRRSAPLVERAARGRVRADRLEASRLHRDGRRSRLRLIVVHHRRHDDLVAFGEEARGDRRTIRSLVVVVRAMLRAGPRVLGDGARGQSPRGERIRIGDGDAAAALRIGDEIADPVDGVGEVLAHLRLRRLIALEVGERERPASAARRAAIDRGPRSR